MHVNMRKTFLRAWTKIHTACHAHTSHAFLQENLILKLLQYFCEIQKTQKTAYSKQLACRSANLVQIT